MIFGDKGNFAIEAMIEPGLERPSSVWGRLCIWVQETSIGDYDDPHCSLWGTYRGHDDICQNIDDLWSKDFENLSDRELWNLLDGKLYGWHGNTPLDIDSMSAEEIERDSKGFWKFNYLTNWGEMFDNDGKSFILSISDKELKILNFDNSADKVNAYICSKEVFEQAVCEFKRWFNLKADFLEKASN